MYSVKDVPRALSDGYKFHPQQQQQPLQQRQQQQQRLTVNLLPSALCFQQAKRCRGFDAIVDRIKTRFAGYLEFDFPKGIEMKLPSTLSRKPFWFETDGIPIAWQFCTQLARRLVHVGDRECAHRFP